MRTIKFRGKRIDNNDWVYGYLWINNTNTMTTTHITNEHGDIYRVVSETVGEYVEYLDAYEGDVLYGSERGEFGELMGWWHGLIKFNKKQGFLMILDDCCDWYYLDDFNYDSVIGNIYDNKDFVENFL